MDICSQVRLPVVKFHTVSLQYFAPQLNRHSCTSLQAFPETVIWKYFVEICLGLFVLHSNRILHRDIKAANLFVGENDTIKV